MQVFHRRTAVPFSAQELFDWHGRPGAFERLTPPWEDVRVLDRTGTGTILENGVEVRLGMRIGPVRLPWIARHEDVMPGRSFRDVQLRGPFARWSHTHTFEPDGDASTLDDRIEYALPLEPLGRWAQGRSVARQLDRMFRYRHATTVEDARSHLALGSASNPMRVAVTGSTGLLGSTLVPYLTTGGHSVVRLVRSRDALTPANPLLDPASEHALWNPGTGEVEIDAIDPPLDAVVHLAGENIARRRWTPAQRERLEKSRTVGTRVLCEALARLPESKRPRVLVAASGTGHYGDRGDEELTEGSAPGTGFLTDICRRWEESTRPAQEAGIRVVHLRIGVVLSPKGSALRVMGLPFRFGLGGRLGSGRQYFSWISIDDVVEAIHRAIVDESLEGAVNGTAPQPVTNAELTRVLARVLRRPAVLPAPAFALRAALGDMAKDLLLAGHRVLPKRLLDAGHRFRHPDLETALRHVLGKPLAT